MVHILFVVESDFVILCIFIVWLVWISFNGDI